MEQQNPPAPRNAEPEVVPNKPYKITFLPTGKTIEAGKVKADANH